MLAELDGRIFILTGQDRALHPSLLSLEASEVLRLAPLMTKLPFDVQAGDIYLITEQFSFKQQESLVRRLHTQNPLCPLIVLTSRVAPKRDAALLQAGAWAYLSVGEMSAASLERSLRYALQKRRWLRDAQETDFHKALTDLSTQVLAKDVDETLFQTVLEQAVRLVPGAQAGSLLYKQGTHFYFVAAVGFDLATLKTIRLSPKEVGYDLKSTDAQLVHSYHAPSERDATKWLVMSEAGPTEAIKVTLSLPVTNGAQVTALINLDNFETGHAFSAAAVAKAQLLAQQVGGLAQRLRLNARLKRSRDDAERLLYIDKLTGLPNERAFLRDLKAAKPKTGYILLLDVDNFRQINDTWGHGVGNALLKEIGLRLGNSLKGDGRLARWSGDEFLLYLDAPETDTDSALQTLTERFKALFAKPFELGERKLYTSVSGGVVPLSYAKFSLEVLLTYADVALGRAKGEGRNTLRLFSKEMMRELHLRQSLEKDLREALREGAFELHYQPLIDLRTSRVVKLEALARWRHPARGAISPSTFIPLAEETGLMLGLSEQLLHMVCKQLGCWQRQGLNLPVAFNLSAQQLEQADIVEHVSDALSNYGVPPELLELELTESTAMRNVAESIERLQGLRSLGLRLAVDDFGVAYSSLTYLKNLPLDILKIDRSFITGIAEDALESPQNASIVRAIVAMAQSLDLSVIAEGVETEGQLKFLRFLGCHVAQGYYFSQPLAPDDLLSWLDNH